MKLEVGLNMKKIKYSVSNLAWTINDESEVIRILKDSKLDGIEISLTKYFPNIESVDSDQVELLKNRWADEKFEITLNLGSGIINLVFLFVHFSIIISV